jgi:hypothetical protein
VLPRMERVLHHQTKPGETLISYKWRARGDTNDVAGRNPAAFEDRRLYAAAPAFATPSARSRRSERQGRQITDTLGGSLSRLGCSLHRHRPLALDDAGRLSTGPQEVSRRGTGCLEPLHLPCRAAWRDGIRGSQTRSPNRLRWVPLRVDEIYRTGERGRRTGEDDQSRR